ncbi:hypothetical protein WQ57_17805 [Mesobacillus campisalis]|uniref:IrrE N-terminal-like domain-containing protein n=1 Tax=Mesobacillus campisalis TaxID=1408103 RepID=A0A0M2SSP4_9BACI|nr:hypothetical protein [Mesobacillus campisalis]KKK36716.1 hypothetical protein WQ57_17805 [Mesobacillus campisalis]
MISYGKFLELVAVAEQMGCCVIYNQKKKVTFNINMSITIPLSTTLENAYALAHEIGHLIDYVNGELDYDNWLKDRSYRIHAEMSAWVHAYKLLDSLDIPLHKWKHHVQVNLGTYLEYDEAIPL